MSLHLIDFIFWTWQGNCQDRGMMYGSIPMFRPKDAQSSGSTNPCVFRSYGLSGLSLPWLKLHRKVGRKVLCGTGIC